MPILILGIRAYKQDNYFQLECDGSCNLLAIFGGMWDLGWGMGEGGSRRGLGTESLLKGMDQYSRHRGTDHLLFIQKLYLSFFSKEPISMRRLTVHIFPLH
jgi:hypothetical protein